MKKLILLLLFLFCMCVAANAQIFGPGLQFTTTDPTGGSCVATSVVVYMPSGKLFTCQNGILTAVSGGGGGGTIATTPNVLAGDNAGNAVSAGFLPAAVALLASPTFTGVPAAPTAAGGTNTTQLATTAFVTAAAAAVTTCATTTNLLAGSGSAAGCVSSGIAPATVVLGAANLSTGGNPGPVPYTSAAGTLNQDATKFCWDATNHRLGVGTCAPADPIDVEVTASDLNSPIFIHNSSTAGGARVTVSNAAGKTGQFSSYGSTFLVTSLQSKASFGADGGIVVFSDAGSSSGGTDAVDIRAGGYDSPATVIYAVSGKVGIGPANTSLGTCTLCVVDRTATTGQSLSILGGDANSHFSATFTTGRVVIGSSQGTHNLFEVTNQSITPQTFIDQNYDFNIVGQKATTGTRYLCIDTNGKIASSASACSGT